MFNFRVMDKHKLKEYTLLYAIETGQIKESRG